MPRTTGDLSPRGHTDEARLLLLDGIERIRAASRHRNAEARCLTQAYQAILDAEQHLIDAHRIDDGRAAA